VTATAQRHNNAEMDISKMILKQRMLKNAVWGLTTPFQRRLCRFQAKLVVHDKEEIQFHIYKLPAL
jgi:hypothetical protein